MCDPVVNSPLSIVMTMVQLPMPLFLTFLRRKSYFKEKIIKSVVDEIQT